MKYLSLFSGIGGFELAIQSVFPDAQCIGYSEIDKHAVKVYSHHFPSHVNLGDITQITKEQLQFLVREHGGCDLIVGGFPCQDLSAANRTRKGLGGKRSGLFFVMLDILKWIKEVSPSVNFVIENVASMTNVNKKRITEELYAIHFDTHVTCVSGSKFGVQNRRRLIWTSFHLNDYTPNFTQTWDNVLLDSNDDRLGACIVTDKSIDYLNKIHVTTYKNRNALQAIKAGSRYQMIETSIKGLSRWEQRIQHMDPTRSENCGPVTCGRCLPIMRFFVEEMEFTIRHAHIVELERLFFFPDGYVSSLCSKTRSHKLLGNSVIVEMIRYVIRSLKDQDME